jgi:V/A-type H+-transporting ATPase subunit E
MDAKIQELTDKIYREGVEKGNEEAQRLVAEAKVQVKKLIRDAEDEASRILADAGKQVAELRKNTVSELKLYAAQSVEALKSEVTNLITGQIVSDNVKAVAADPEFMKKVILEMAKGWAEHESVTIQTSDAKALTDYFASHAKDLLNKSVKIEQISGKPASFVISPAGGSYKITFGEDELAAYFKEFLRPQVIEMLFR